MYIRIIDKNKRTERRVHADSVNLDSENWLITICGKLNTFSRRDFEVLIFA